MIFIPLFFPTSLSMQIHPFSVTHKKTNRHPRDNNKIVDKIKQYIGIEQNQLTEGKEYKKNSR